MCAQTCFMQRLFCISLIPYGENIEFHINNNSFYRYFLALRTNYTDDIERYINPNMKLRRKHS